MENKDLELYKLLFTEDNVYKTSLVQEIRWELYEDRKELLVWVSYLWVNEFMESLKDIFGESVFRDYGFEGLFQSNCICLDLYEILENYEIDLEEIFPIKEYC